MNKVCPFRWGEPAGNSIKCVLGMCTFWVDGECAIVKLAKAVSKEEEK